MGGNSAPTSPGHRRASPNGPVHGKTAAEGGDGASRKSRLKSSQALNIKQVISSCRSNFARELKKTFMMDEDLPAKKGEKEVDHGAPNNVRTRSTSSLTPPSPKGPSTRGNNLVRLARSVSARSFSQKSPGDGDSDGLFSDENNRKLARQIWESCEKASGDNYKTAAAATGGTVQNGRISRSRSSLLMISNGPSSMFPSTMHKSRDSSTDQETKSAMPSPTDRRCSPRTAASSKSSSAPPSPIKPVSDIPASKGAGAPCLSHQKMEKGAKKRPPNTSAEEELAVTTSKRPRLIDSKANKRNKGVLSATVHPETAANKPPTPTPTATPTPPATAARKKAAPMDEVMKLHQDEGVFHLLHSLPTSRRKEKVNYFPTAKQQQQQQQQQQGGNSASDFVGNAKGARASLLSSMRHPNKRLSPSSTSSTGGRSSPLLAIATQIAAQVSESSNVSFSPVTKPRKKDQKKKNNLIRISGSVAPVSTEELLTPKVLDLLKKLPKSEYLHLWSSTSRYKLAEEALAVATTTSRNEGGKQPSVSPDSSVGSDISSASKLANTIESLRRKPKRIGDRMLTNVTIISKQYKEILLRSYPTFTQILLSPSASTGLKQSLGVACMEELLDALELLRDRDDPTASAVMVTGMGNIFSQGIDLTLLTHEGQQEKQRKSAEALAGCVRRLVLCLLSYPKVTVAAVNGMAVGLGVAILPYFDLVYASDRAVFRTDYVRLGQIPEGFASVSLGPAVSASGPAREMLLTGRAITAEEAAASGIVTRVVWPDKIMEEIVPRMENLEELSQRGLLATKAYMRESLKHRVAEVAEEETRLLVRSWTRPDFAANLKKYLKTTNQVIFQ